MILSDKAKEPNWHLLFACSPDARFVCTGEAHSNNPGIRIWDLESAKLFREMKLAKQELDRTEVVAASFAEDGRAVQSVFENGLVRAWEVATGKELWTWQIHRFPRAIFSADGRLLLTNSAGPNMATMTLWDMETRKQVWSVLLEVPKQG